MYGVVVGYTLRRKHVVLLPLSNRVGCGWTVLGICFVFVVHIVLVCVVCLC